MLDWQKVGPFFYRTRDIYLYPSHLGRSEVVDPRRILTDSSLVSICPFGGPVACVHARRLFIFTPSFRIISEQSIDQLKSDLIGLWWTFDPEPLIKIASSDGSILTLEVSGQIQSTEKLPSSVKSVLAVAVDRSRFAARPACVYLTDKMKLFHSSLGYLESGSFRSPVVCYAICGNTLLVSLEDGSLLLMDMCAGGRTISLIDASHDASLQILILEVSLSGDFVASFTANGVVSVYSAQDLVGSGVLKPVESSLIDIGIPPTQLAWVGDDCLCVSFTQGSRNVLFLGGVGGSWSPYEHESRVFVSSDVLGASVLTCSRFQAIQRVAASTVNLSSSNGASPEAQLLLGYQMHARNDLQAESIIRSIKDQLEKAVVALAEAAAYETPVVDSQDRIEMYLKASIFGRQFSPSVLGSNLFVNAASLVRVCAALNKAEIGIPISVPQLMKLGPRQTGGSLLVQLLAARGLYLLASRVGKWLGVSTACVVDKWACALIASSDHLPDRDLCEMILERVPCRHSLARIARFAFKDAGRKNLSILLLHKESNVAEQVQLLLDLDCEDLAIQKALAADDVDAVHVCFDALISRKKSFQELVTSKSGSLTQSEVGMMLGLVQSRYYSEKRYEELCKLFQSIPGSELLSADSGLELAVSKFSSGISLSKSEESADWIQYGAERFADCVIAPSVVGQAGTNSPAGCQSTAGLLAESAQLIRAQIQLEKTAAAKGWPRGPHKFVGLSLFDTLKRLVVLNEIAEAENLRSRRKISDGKWWELRVKSLFQIKLEEGINFVNRVLPPTSDCRGYKVVVETLLGVKREDLALPFIRKLKPKRQVEIFNQLGLYEEARAALNQKSSGGLLGKLASGFMGNR